MMLPLEERLMDAARDVCLRLNDQLTDCNSLQRLSETVERAAARASSRRGPMWPAIPVSLFSRARLARLASLAREASATQLAGWRRLTEAPGSLGHDLAALNGASGSPAGRRRIASWTTAERARC